MGSQGQEEDSVEHYDWTEHEPKEWQRFCLGFQGRFVDDCVLNLQGGKVQVSLAQAPSAKSSAKKQGAKLDKGSDPALTGTTVWDGAIVLSQYLTSPQGQQMLRDHGAFPSGSAKPRCLELGAGTGAVSLALLACRCVSRATITDLPDMLPHLKLNLQRNGGVVPPGVATVQALQWGEAGAGDISKLQPAPPYDLVVGADLIYYSYCEATPHSELLLWTLQRVASPRSVVLLALSLHHNPGEVRSFVARAADRFVVETVTEGIPEEYRVPDVLVIRMTLRDSAC